MKILAIDTSADETSVAITEDFRVLSSTISSQISAHAKWGGIVPSIARLAHEERIDAVVNETLRKAQLSQGEPLKPCFACAVPDWSTPSTAQNRFLAGAKISSNPVAIDAVAVTYGPGLSIALEVGIKKAKQLATAWGKRLIAVNHMEGHMYSPYISNSKGNPKREVIYPFLSLLISGGHTQIFIVTGNGQFGMIGQSVDDAAGEALDKAAKMLGLGYPGGQIIERLSLEVQNIDKYNFPRPMIHNDDCMMSFSGLKTHLYYFLKGQKGQTVDINNDLQYLASSFQEAVFGSVISKLSKAVKDTGVATIAVGGGVSINKRLRYLVRKLAKQYHGQALFPPYNYLCGDNASMIGIAAHLQALRADYVTDFDSLDRVPRLKL